MNQGPAEAGLRRRSRLLAAVLAYFVPPVGFAYVRRIKWGIGFLLAGPVLLLLAGRLGVPFLHGGYLGLLACAVAVALSAPVVAFAFARRLPVGAAPRWYNRWYHYLWIGLVSIGLVQIIFGNRALLFGYEPFRIPSTAMQPTLVPGDFIVVDSRAGAISEVRRGDIVTFAPTHRPGETWIKRVIGLPGERVLVDGNSVTVDGILLDEPWSTVDQPVFPLPGRFMQATLGPDEFYLMGDNRPNSEDSRFTGPVNRHQLRGKARAIWFHYSPFTHSIETSRIGILGDAPTD